jgi:hypothetical protein
MSGPFIPTPGSAYALPVDTKLYRETWNAAFASMHSRLVAAETILADVDTVLDEVEAQALQLINVTLAADVQDARDQITALGALVAAAEDDINALLTAGIPASSIPVSAIVNLTANNVQAALAELQGDLTALLGNLAAQGLEIDAIAAAIAALPSIATEGEAAAGSSNTTLMTPLRTAQLIDVRARTGIATLMAYGAI